MVERYAYVLDYLPNGRSTERGFSRQPVALAVGEDELKLLEIVPKPNVPLSVGRRIPLLPEGSVAPPIDHVRRRVPYEELTVAARAELPTALEAAVRARADRYLRFFNEADAVSRRFHLLELLPGIGKKTMQAIVDERRKGPFASFEEMERRVPIKAPTQLVVSRILAELTGVEDKYRLFVAP